MQCFDWWNCEQNLDLDMIMMILLLQVTHERLRKKLYIDEESDAFCQMVAQ